MDNFFETTELSEVEVKLLEAYRTIEELEDRIQHAVDTLLDVLNYYEIMVNKEKIIQHVIKGLVTRD